MRLQKVLLGVCLLSTLLSYHTVSAESYEIRNDGKEKKKSEIYKDSGLPSSFEGAEYYDVAMPYELSAYDIGGCCIDANPKSEYVYDTKKLKSIKMSGSAAIEYYSFETGRSSSSGLLSSKQWDAISKDVKVDKDTGLIVTKVNGVTFFLNVLQKFECNNSTAKKWDAWNKNGYLCDAILTDGTVIHFIKIDSNAEVHTNGGADGKGDNGQKHPDFGANPEDKWWKWDKTKLPQYSNIYGVSGCNTWEVWSPSDSFSKFKKYFNIGSEDGQNRLAYYRIYNIDVTQKDKIKPVSDEVKKLSYKLGDVKLADGSSTSKDKNAVNIKQTGKYQESHFVEVPMLLETKMALLKEEELSAREIKGVDDWRKNVEFEEGNKPIKYIRVFVMFFGIIFLVWVLLLYLSYWFDRINTFFDIALLPMLTGNRLRVAPEEYECTFNPKNVVKGETQTVNHKAILEICGVGIFVAVLVISGKLYDILNFLIHKLLSWAHII